MAAGQTLPESLPSSPLLAYAFMQSNQVRLPTDSVSASASMQFTALGFGNKHDLSS
jgi:hypothetical protein